MADAATSEDTRCWCNVCYRQFDGEDANDEMRTHLREKHGVFGKGETPADAIPDLPGNEEVRDFLKKAPTKGLYMPLGKEVKVMQCWRCKRYGHRTGDRECPLFLTGNAKSEAVLKASYDPMYEFMEKKKAEKNTEAQERVAVLKALLAATSSDSDSSSGRKRKKKKKDKKKKEKKKRRSGDHKRSDDDKRHHHHHHHHKRRRST